MTITITETVPPKFTNSFDPQLRLFRASYQRTLCATTTSRNEGPAAIRAALSVTEGATYHYRTESDAGAFLIQISIEPDTSVDDLYTWSISLDYGPLDPTEFGGGEDPTALPPEISGGFNSVEEIVDEDINGDPIINTAGDYFDPPVTREKRRPIISITMNYLPADFDLATLLQYGKGAINSDVWAGCAIGTLKVIPSSYSRQNHPVIGWYWQVQYEFEYNADGWARSILNQGLRKLNTGGTAQEDIYINGSKVSSPVLLDSSGHVLAVAGTPVYLDFDIYDSLPFAALGLSAAEALLA